MEKINIIKNYEGFTDKYFPRGKIILQMEGINPIVRYQIFARKDIERLSGMDEAVDFIKGVVRDKAKIYALRDNQKYEAGEPMMKIEGRVQDLIDLETVYLGILSGNLTGKIDMAEVRKKARDIKKEAKDKTVNYFGARHFYYSLDEEIARICKEEGFAGCSTDVGARAWGQKGGGTIPHASTISYTAHMHANNIKGNPTVEAAKGFDRYIDKKVPRVNLIDTFNREIEDSIETAKAVPSLAAVRIDTCGENYTQGSMEVNLPKINVPEKYLFGRGVKIASVWALRKGLIDGGYEKVNVLVSSGFNAEKTAAFMEADKVFQERYGLPLFTGIGTGSIANPIMTTSDIVAYFNEMQGIWIPMSKVGRGEKPSERLEEIR